MFDEMIIREGSVKNVVDADGAVTGFSFATITVLRDGGLAAGEHEIFVNLRLRVSYLPFLSENRFTRTVTVAA